jgi:hypothetical protein
LVSQKFPPSQRAIFSASVIFFVIIISTPNTLLANDLRGILLQFINDPDELLLQLRVEEAHKTTRLVKGRPDQFRHVLHITVLDNIINDLMDKGNLVGIKVLFVDEVRKGLKSGGTLSRSTVQSPSAAG